jgi:hypothetical protein
MIHKIYTALSEFALKAAILSENLYGTLHYTIYIYPGPEAAFLDVSVLEITASGP